MHAAGMILNRQVNERVQLLKESNKLTFKIVSIRSRHLSKADLISCETVMGLGRTVPGRPVFISKSNWRSATIFAGWLLSAHHVAIWVVNDTYPWLGVQGYLGLGSRYKFIKNIFFSIKYRLLLLFLCYLIYLKANIEHIKHY
jgi:hypothetical protein